MSNEENNDDEEKKNDWKKFLYALLKNVILCLILIFIGTNFALLSRIDLEKIFPTDVERRPYRQYNKKTYMLLPGENSDFFSRQKPNNGCGEGIMINNPKITDNMFMIKQFNYGWPYTMLKSYDNQELTFGNQFLDWFANIVEYSYVWQRMSIQSIFNFVNGACGFSKDNNTIPFILGLFIVPLILIVFSHIWWLPTIFSSLFNAKTWFQIIVTLLGYIFVYSWLLVIGLNFVQAFGLMFKFLVLPPMLNFDEWKKILGSKGITFTVMFIFILLVILSSFDCFETTISVTITCVLAFLYGSSLYYMLNPSEKNNENRFSFTARSTF